MKVFCIFILISALSSQIIGQNNYFKSVDGPYILKDSIFRVTDEYILMGEPLDQLKRILVEVDNDEKDQFYFELDNRKYKRPKDKHSMPEALLAISDIEGNFNAFQSFLIANKVMDTSYNWIFGEGHLVLNGDFVDRGKNVIPVLWLIYHLEKEAEKAGGCVHFILGNHEIMNLHGDIRYAENKYKIVAQKIINGNSVDESFISLYSAETELGSWLRSKNIIEKIGPYIFTHAGLSPALKEVNVRFKEMNMIFRKYVDSITTSSNIELKVKTVFGNNSPFWYRGLMMHWQEKPKLEQEKFNELLNFYKAQKLVVGHTVVDNVSTDYSGKLIRIDVKHGDDKRSKKTQGLFIQNDIEYMVNGLGEKFHLD